MLIVTKHPSSAIARVTTWVDDPRTWRRKYSEHAAVLSRVGPRGGFGPTCFEDEIPCQGQTVYVETCCEPQEPIEDCYARHTAAVQEVIDRCD